MLSLFFGELEAGEHELGVASGLALNQGGPGFWGIKGPSPFATALGQELLPLFRTPFPGRDQVGKYSH